MDKEKLIEKLLSKHEYKYTPELGYSKIYTIENHKIHYLICVSDDCIEVFQCIKYEIIYRRVFERNLEIFTKINSLLSKVEIK